MKIERPVAKQFAQASNGEHIAVLADIIDLGVVNSKFGAKPKLQLVFLIDEKDEEGELIRVSHFVNKSWWETSNLAKCIEALSDGALVDDTEELIGACCRIMTKQYTHPTTGKVYANILDIYGMKPGTPKLKIPLDFVRKKDQPAKPGKTSKK